MEFTAQVLWVYTITVLTFYAMDQFLKTDKLDTMDWAFIGASAYCNMLSSLIIVSFSLLNN